MFVLTFSPLGEKVNTNMALIHRQVKKSTLGKIVNNYPFLFSQGEVRILEGGGGIIHIYDPFTKRGR